MRLRPACMTYRRAWLDASSSGATQVGASGLESGASESAAAGHAAACLECRVWTLRSLRVAGVLSTLDRHAAPDELERRLVEEFERVRTAARAAGTPGSKALGVLGTLERLSAPPVLDRLVAEELADPERASVARHLRRLERRRAPGALAEHAAELRSLPPPPRRRRIAAAALVGLAAAGLVWLGLGRPLPESRSAPDRDRSPMADRGPVTPHLTEPTRVDTPSGLAPQARGLVAVLAPQLVHGEPWSEAEPLAALRREPRIPPSAPIEAPSEVRRLLEGSPGAELPVLQSLPAPAPDGPSSPNASLASPGAASFYTGLSGVPHVGLRQVEIASPMAGGGTRLLAFREAIVTDGRGAYRIEPFDVLTRVSPDPETFLLLQRARQGHSFRYRDFAIRDAGLFARNYEVERTGELVQVAGRSCRLVNVTHRRGERSFRLAVDLQTGVILSDREFDAQGTLVRSVEYVDFDPAPDLKAFGPSRASSEEMLTPEEVDELTGGRAWRPRTTPADHFLVAVSFVGDDLERWVKWTFSDGVKPLFFLHRPSDGLRPRNVEEENVTLQVFSSGTLRAVYGDWGDDEFLAVGSVSEEALLDLVESALP